MAALPPQHSSGSLSPPLSVQVGGCQGAQAAGELGGCWQEASVAADGDQLFGVSIY